MSDEIEPVQADRPEFLRKVGFWGVLIGGLALILVFSQIIGPSMESRSTSAGTQIGEIAGEIKRSAWRSFLGLSQPEPEPLPKPVSVWLYAGFVGPILGVIAIILSMVSGVMRENWRFSVYGTALGASAVVFHYFWWVAVLIACAVVLVAIIENIGDIFSF